MMPVWTLVIFSRGRVVGLATYAQREGAVADAGKINKAGKEHVWAQVWESSILDRRGEAA